MATPKYFRNFPNIQYAISVNSAGIPNYITIKDYFNLLKVRDDIFKQETLYTDYYVKNGERPDQISYNTYGDEQYYWIVLQINEIVDYYNDWPLSQLELNQFILNKYGSDAAAAEIHHYETVEVTDTVYTTAQDVDTRKRSEKNILLHAGLEVPEDFVFYYKPILGSSVVLSSLPVSVTNREYEDRLNERKSQIQLLQPKYVYDYVREVQKYGKNLSPQRSFVDLSSVVRA